MTNQPKHNYIAGKAYKTSQGKKEVYVGENPFNPSYPFIFAETSGFLWHRDTDGNRYWNGECIEIIGEWQEPKKVKGWVNVNPDFKGLAKAANHFCGPIFVTRKMADEFALDTRIACIPIEFTEGEGL